MSSSIISQSIEALCNEHGLDREKVLEAMKDAVKAAARKQFKAYDKSSDSIQVEWSPEEGLVISARKDVVETVTDPNIQISLEEAQELAGEDVDIGDSLLFPLPNEEMGRIAAQTAKQILVQKVREAVRKKIYEEYYDQRGQLVNGIVKRFERGDIIVELQNNIEAVLPKREQARGESWSQGERIRAVIIDVTEDPKGQQIKLSRSSPELLKRLFEMEVPEIYDGTVVIKSAVRDAGGRAKIAVASNEKDVDPVGACVGMKGSRVQSIIKELRGEKIDIIEWSDEPSVFAANALSPAKVSQVRITDIDKRKMTVIVSEDQLSLAIGKGGQNVRLATKLVGWDIDIISEEVLKKEIALQMGRMMAQGEVVPLTAIEGVKPNQAEILAEKGIDDVEKLANLSIDNLVDYLDLTYDEADKILKSAQSIIEARNTGGASLEDEATATGPEGESTESENQTEELENKPTGQEKKPSDEDLNEGSTEDSNGFEFEESAEGDEAERDEEAEPNYLDSKENSASESVEQPEETTDEPIDSEEGSTEAADQSGSDDSQQESSKEEAQA
ncbi:MAG TPA: transcription termination factor NusA [Pyrinomonadaceae bacterium]|nr:transcription termination factor NusA [Pyrinomonadaceae bacterium]